MQETSVTFNAQMLRVLGLGLHGSIADLLWIQTLIQGDLEHYRGNDLTSWMYVRFRAISILDPRFYENYVFGGQYLMIIKDDLAGAEALMTKGLEYYPDSVELNWHLGFLWIYEKNEPAKGYRYFEKISQNPKRPPMFDSVFTRLKAQEVGKDAAFEFALASWRQQPDGSPIKERLGVILHSLKAERDLECLNQGRIGCDKVDWNGQPYLNERGVWYSSKPLAPVKFFKKKKP